MKKTILVIFGTRPEAIKMCPLILELRKRSCFNVVVCVTGQHKEMLDSVLKSFNIKPEFNLNIMRKKQTLSDITSEILLRIGSVLDQVKPDLVLVHGDTTTSFAAALSCFYSHYPVGHVEAGLRTYNLTSPFPEEFNRKVISIISKFNFAPTQQARENLLKEGIPDDSIFVTGNTGIDALFSTVKASYSNPELDWVSDSRLILITAHRRENLGQPMENMFKAIKRCMDEHPDLKAIYPIHLNPVVRETAKSIFKNDDRIHLIEPLDVIDFHNFMARSYLILTDSGGIQEEAPALGRPVLVMRDTTERPEGVEAGVLRLIGTNEKDIYNNFKELVENESEYKKMSQASNPYGDGTSSKLIADILYSELGCDFGQSIE